jgi:hypothetical protein
VQPCGLEFRPLVALRRGLSTWTPPPCRRHQRRTTPSSTATTTTSCRARNTSDPSSADVLNNTPESAHSGSLRRTRYTRHQAGNHADHVHHSSHTTRSSGSTAWSNRSRAALPAPCEPSPPPSRLAYPPDGPTRTSSPLSAARPRR